MALLTLETILLLHSFGNLAETVSTGDKILIRADQFDTLVSLLEKNQLFYEMLPYDGIDRIMIILNKK